MKAPDVVVVGAGVMGLWTALRLRDRGLGVTVVDPWEPGHPRGTSSSESRVIRSLYGSDEVYASWSWTSLAAWEQQEHALGATLLHKTGVLWFAGRDRGYEAVGEATLRRLGIPVERLTPSEVTERFPGVRCDGLAFALFEPRGAAILAREAMRRLAPRWRGGASASSGGRPGWERSGGGRLIDVAATTNA